MWRLWREGLGKAGLGIVCECGHVFEAETGEVKPGLGERVYAVLRQKYGG